MKTCFVALACQQATRTKYLDEVLSRADLEYMVPQNQTHQEGKANLSYISWRSKPSSALPAAAEQTHIMGLLRPDNRER